MYFQDLKGMVLAKVTVAQQYSDDQIVFETACGKKFKMRHQMDCCESVYIEDICGDIDDLLGSPIVVAEEVVSNDVKPFADPFDQAEHVLRYGKQDETGYDESYTWTFYKLDTVKGGVTIRWFGTSNGYYSESVDFLDIT